MDIDNTERIEAATRDQSDDSELWHAMKKGRLTNSQFGEIRNRNYKGDHTEIQEDWSRDIMGYGKQMKTSQICWGQENEQKTIKYSTYLRSSICMG